MEHGDPAEVPQSGTFYPERNSHPGLELVTS